MNEPRVTPQQLKRLQTIWTQYARHEIIENGRVQRLAWASSAVRRPLKSFSDLTLAEARTLINLLQAEMGIAETSPPRRQKRLRSAISDRGQARAAGTAGRKDGQPNQFQIASAEDISMITVQIESMGWTRDRLGKFLASPSSPLRKKGTTEIRTLADVNRVIWALRGIARREGRKTGVK